MRTAAHSAWVTPVVMAASAAPAMAVSTPTAVTVIVMQLNTTNPRTVQLQFDSTTDTTSVVATVVITPTTGTAADPRRVIVSGWTVGNVSGGAGPGDPLTFTFTKDDGVIQEADRTIAFFEFTLGSDLDAGTISVTVQSTPTNSNTAPATGFYGPT